MMKHYIDLEKSIGHCITELQTNPYMSEVWTFDHPTTAHRAHFFKNNNSKYSAKGVLVSKESNKIIRTISSMADMTKLRRGFGWKLESFCHPLYTTLAEIAFRKWLGKPDMREALKLNDAAFVKECDPTFHDLLVFYGMSYSERHPNRKGLWPYDTIKWNTRTRFQYRGKEHVAHRSLYYLFPRNVREQTKLTLDFRIDVARKENTAPNLTISRRYPIDDWPNTKKFIALPENEPYLEVLFNELDVSSE